MIVDCHTHVWQSPDQLGQLELGELPRPAKRRSPRTLFRPMIPSADADHHWAQSGTVDKSIVLGFKSRYLKAEVPNRYIADYVSRFPGKLIGFAGIDPTERGAAKEVRIAKEDLQLRGLTLSPANQDFHPSDTRAMAVYAADPHPPCRPIHRTKQARIRPPLSLR
jgi:predicted TIM-barrel fold metal-dependent hydrolase